MYTMQSAMYAASALTGWQHYFAWNDVMAAILKVWRHIKTSIRLRHSIRTYLKNNPAKFHPDPIWNDGDLGLFWKESPQQDQQQDE